MILLCGVVVGLLGGLFVCVVLVSVVGCFCWFG